MHSRKPAKFPMLRCMHSRATSAIEPQIYLRTCCNNNNSQSPRTPKEQTPTKPIHQQTKCPESAFPEPDQCSRVSCLSGEEFTKTSPRLDLSGLWIFYAKGVLDMLELWSNEGGFMILLFFFGAFGSLALELLYPRFLDDSP